MANGANYSICFLKQILSIIKFKTMNLSSLVTGSRPYTSEDALNQLIKTMNADTNRISDGFHTFAELYEFRKIYNAALFNVWGNYMIPQYDVHKSRKHSNGELCFGGEWFIVVAVLPTGQISNHYEAKDWDLFKIPSVEKAKYEYDGHTPQDVIARLKAMNY